MTLLYFIKTKHCINNILSYIYKKIATQMAVSIILYTHTLYFNLSVSSRGPSPRNVVNDSRNLEFAAGNLEIYWKFRNLLEM